MSQFLIQSKDLRQNLSVILIEKRKKKEKIKKKKEKGAIKVIKLKKGVKAIKVQV